MTRRGLPRFATGAGAASDVSGSILSTCFRVSVGDTASVIGSVSVVAVARRGLGMDNSRECPPCDGGFGLKGVRQRPAHAVNQTKYVWNVCGSAITLWQVHAEYPT